MSETVADRAQRTLDAWEAGADVRYGRWRAMVQELLAAIQAAEAERDSCRLDYRELFAEIKAEREDYADRLGNVTRQRDQARWAATHWEQRATRLAALEQAARAWAEAQAGVQRIKGEAFDETWQDRMQQVKRTAALAHSDLLETVAALAAAPWRA